MVRGLRLVLDDQGGAADGHDQRDDASDALVTCPWLEVAGGSCATATLASSGLDKEQRVLGLGLFLSDHGAPDRHDDGDDAMDPFGRLALAGLRLPAGSWATATLAAIQRVTGLPPCASFLETMSFSSSRVGAAMERNPWRNSTIAAPSSCRRSAMWVAFQGS